MAGTTRAKARKEKHIGYDVDYSSSINAQLGESSPYVDVLSLQRAVGNRAVNQLLQLPTEELAPPSTIEDVLKSDSGEPLDTTLSSEMQSRFGQDFSQVRVHTGAKAAGTARQLGSRAFTVDQEIVFAPGRYAPYTPTGKELLAHELAHTLQNRYHGKHKSETILFNSGSHAEIEAEAAASAFSHNAAIPTIAAAPSAALQRSPEKDLIDKHTSLNFLNEESLATELLSLAKQGNYEIIHQVLDRLNTTDRDDVSEILVTQASSEELDQMTKSDQGRRLLDRLYDELTSGSASSDEKKQSEKILSAKTRQISPEDFLKGKENAKIFPYRKAGITVFDDAPILARLAGRGKVRVKIPVRVLGSEKYRRDTKTLPAEVFSQGIDLPENEIVGVRLYDEGGKLVHYPALYLVQIGNETVTNAYQTMGEVAGLGLSLGSGTAIGAGAKGLSWGARALLYADRATTVLGAVTTVINDHRGWFIERFGEDGREFVEAMDTVNSVVAIYGIGRVAFGMGKLVYGLRKSYQKWRTNAKNIRKQLDDAETDRLNRVEKETQEFLQQTEQAREAQKAQRAAETTETLQKPRSAVAQKAEKGIEGGSDAIADVIDIRTKKPRKTPVEPTQPASSSIAQVVENIEESEGVISLEKYKQKKQKIRKKKSGKREATTGSVIEEEVVEEVEAVQAMAGPKKGSPSPSSSIKPGVSSEKSNVRTLPGKGKPQPSSGTKGSSTPKGGVEVELTEKEQQRIETLGKILQREGKWSELEGRDPLRLGRTFDKIIQSLVEYIVAGGRGKYLHYVEVSTDLINQYRKVGGKLVITEGRLVGAQKRFDLVEIDFDKKTIELIDLTSIDYPRHVEKTALYKQILMKLTGFPVEAMEMRYVGTDGELLEMLMKIAVD